jgi:thiamine-monophosphate kinase
MLASASIDVSVGVVGDLTKLCRVSQVAATVQVARVPLSEAAQAALADDASLRETALTGGDDYEILCSVPLASADSFRAAARSAHVEVTEIGAIAVGQAARFVDEHGAALTFSKLSFSHF